MVVEKRNEFLDASEDEEDAVVNSDSDDDLKKGGRQAKRRKVASDNEDGSEPESEGDSLQEKTDKKKRLESEPSNAKHARSTDHVPDITKSFVIKKNLVASEAAIKKSGVVYLSRIPPFMKPTKLRSLLEPYGKINRIFLAPEDPTAHARRVKNGGNKKKSYTEGWVEFVKKKDAKVACELLNAKIIGGKKGNYYHDDIWNLLYLKGFKWHNLTEQIAAENAERTSRMRAEISKTTKENKEFVRNVERAKMLDGMQSKAKKRKVDDAAEDGSVGENKGRAESRAFRQVPLAKKGSLTEEQPEQVTRVLSKIF